MFITICLFAAGVMKLLAGEEASPIIPRCAVLYNSKSDIATDQLPDFVTAVYTPGGKPVVDTLLPSSIELLAAADVLLATPDTLARVEPPQGGTVWSQVNHKDQRITASNISVRNGCLPICRHL